MKQYRALQDGTAALWLLRDRAGEAEIVEQAAFTRGQCLEMSDNLAGSAIADGYIEEIA